MTPDIYDGEPIEEPVEPVDAPVDEPVEEPIEEPADVEPTVELDPEFTSWLADKDPAAVRKTFERFTNELETVKSKERELEPLVQLRDNLQNDPGLIRAIEEYYARGPEDPDPEAKVAQLEQRLNQFQAMTATERQLEHLHSAVSKDGNPDFEDTELLRFATENRIGNLEVAYKALKHEEILEAQVRKHDEEIKANAKARVETRPKSTAAVSTKVTLSDLMNMSDAEFAEHAKKH